MGFDEYVTRTKPLIDKAIRRQLQTLVAAPSPSESSLLSTVIGSGKRIRGCLLCLVSEACGAPADAALSRAVAIELVHAATLIHDDFVDGDVVRRNRPATWTLQGARRAVLLGDLMFASAIRMMTDLGRADGRVISDAIAQVATGAFREPVDESEMIRIIESGSLDDALYNRIVCLKTGVLFASACELGAIAAGAPQEVQERLRRYGLCIGEAYQIADDLQELRLYMTTGGEGSYRLLGFALALCTFASESRPLFLAALRDGRTLTLLESCFAQAGGRMEAEIHERLRRAAAEVENLRLDRDDPVQTAPWDIVRMFSQSP